jgi:hypothetical protein
VLKVYSETIKFPPNACREQPGVRGRTATIKPVRLSLGVVARGLIAKRDHAAIAASASIVLSDRTRSMAFETAPS